MKHLYTSRKGDWEFIQGKYDEYCKKLELTLIEMYNREVEIGLVGVHAQALHIIALHLTFKKRFGKSPIIIEEKMIITKEDLMEHIMNTQSKFLDNRSDDDVRMLRIEETKVYFGVSGHHGAFVTDTTNCIISLTDKIDTGYFST